MRILSTAALLIALVVPHAAQADTPSLAMYGNWCGPGTPTTANAPIDPLDNACMRHDMCYENLGVATCDCDIGFMNELRSLPYPNSAIQDKARAMYDAIGSTPCDDPAGWTVKQSRMWSDIAGDALSGRALPFEVPARWMDLFSDSQVRD